MSANKYDNVYRLTANGDKASDAETGDPGKLNPEALYATSSGTVKNGAGNIVWEPQAAGALPLNGCVPFNDIEWDSGTGVLYIYAR